MLHLHNLLLVINAYKMSMTDIFVRCPFNHAGHGDREFKILAYIIFPPTLCNKDQTFCFFVVFTAPPAPLCAIWGPQEGEEPSIHNPGMGYVGGERSTLEGSKEWRCWLTPKCSFTCPTCFKYLQFSYLLDMGQTVRVPPKGYYNVCSNNIAWILIVSIIPEWYTLAFWDLNVSACLYLCVFFVCSP